MANRRRWAAFTLVEVMVATAVMSIVATFAYATILATNRSAVSNRLYTMAQEMARDQVDRIECATPFNPQLTPPQLPPELTLGTTTKTVPLYVDPTTSATVVNATMTTLVTDTGSYNSRAALVTVQFVFRGHTYQVQMNTLRASDS